MTLFVTGYSYNAIHWSDIFMTLSTKDTLITYMTIKVKIYIYCYLSFLENEDKFLCNEQSGYDFYYFSRNIFRFYNRKLNWITCSSIKSDWAFLGCVFFLNIESEFFSRHSLTWSYDINKSLYSNYYWYSD